MKKREVVKDVVAIGVSLCVGTTVGLALGKVVGYGNLTKGYKVVVRVASGAMGGLAGSKCAEYAEEFVDDVCEIGSDLKGMISKK